MSQRGFNITELMIVVAIVAILLTIGIPSFRYITNSYRMSAEVNGLLGDLQYARAEAIKEGQGVTVCISSDGVNCTGTTNWQNGWVIFSNPNSAANPPAGSILRVQGAFTGATPDTFVATNGVSLITYNREGFATTTAGFLGTTIKLHDSSSNAAWTRCMWITAVGLATTETPSNNLSGDCS
ncbi:MAG TPA: GspH/FimT family pseudopilin [Steroidobacteraceae bacterium]|jgi:type IV fimbrial biogenesis protein FimT|nr:GspH/FimT family pseudopilin [Steroidobacteraceae bacterium]